jgi:hypothetical protein
VIATRDTCDSKAVTQEAQCRWGSREAPSWSMRVAAVAKLLLDMLDGSWLRSLWLMWNRLSLALQMTFCSKIDGTTTSPERGMSPSDGNRASRWEACLRMKLDEYPREPMFTSSSVVWQIVFDQKLAIDGPGKVRVRRSSFIECCLSSMIF